MTQKQAGLLMRMAKGTYHAPGKIKAAFSAAKASKWGKRALMAVPPAYLAYRTYDMARPYYNRLEMPTSIEPTGKLLSETIYQKIPKALQPMPLWYKGETDLIKSTRVRRLRK